MIIVLSSLVDVDSTSSKGATGRGTVVLHLPCDFNWKSTHLSVLLVLIGETSKGHGNL